LDSSLDQLDLSAEERSKLQTLGVSTPLALAALRRASRAAFDAYIGACRAAEIARQAESLLSEEELKWLNRPLTKLPPVDMPGVS